MPNTPVKSDEKAPNAAAASELETLSRQSSATDAVAATITSSGQNAADKAPAKENVLIGPNGEKYQPRGNHWAITEWLVRCTAAAKIETRFNQRASLLSGTKESSPSAGTRN